jgi:hypothetical protein
VYIKKLGSIVLAAAVIMTASAGAVKADPKEKQTQQIAIAGTVLSGYLLSKENTRTAGVVAAAGTAYAWKKHNDAVQQRRQYQNYYGGGYDPYYSSGGYDPYYDGRYSSALSAQEVQKAEAKRQEDIRKANQKYQKNVQKAQTKAVKTSSKRR